MERASEDHFGRVSLRHEHTHRYQLAAHFAQKVVVDCACGIGYGSEIIASGNAIESYLGIDPSQEAIDYAREHYAGERVRFEVGTLEKNSCASASVDRFLMFETLEHTEKPATALLGIRRCLKRDGLLIGSVPSAEYEDLCQSTYGPNPFHLQKFTKEKLVELLGAHFEAVRIFSMEFLLGSLFQSMGDARGNALQLAPAGPDREAGINGSIVFVAGSAAAVSMAMDEFGVAGKFFPSVPKVVLDRDEVGPIRTAMLSMEELIRDRDAVIAAQAPMLEERWLAMQAMEALIRERDAALAAQSRLLEARSSAMHSMEALIRDRDAVIGSMEALIRDRDEVIAAQSPMLEERWSAIQSMEALIRGRDVALAAQSNMLEERSTAMQSMEALIRDRDAVITDQSSMLDARWSAMQSMEALIRDRDAVITDQSSMLDARWSAMQSMEALVRDRDVAIAAQARALDERGSAMEALKALIHHRDAIITEQKELLEKRPTIREASGLLRGAVRASLRYRLSRALGKSGRSINPAANPLRAETDFDLFPELATTLFCFTQRLYDTLTEQGAEHVYFLSREGQPLKRMFDLYRDRVGGRIASHYLEVSRRSTLLPSLAPLAEENFETLFRQYRRISLIEFLSSLGLEDHAPGIALALGMSGGAESQREEDFPTSPTFVALKGLAQFQALYETERVLRRQAFNAYLSELSGGAPPAQLVIVDVGWKGTIQDNLFALLCRDSNTPVRRVTGYYIGLVAEGAAGPNNDKHGLLFSSIGATSPRFRVFNENRALFEVLLAADHGSIVSYEIASGRARPIRGEFTERDMLTAAVFPVQRFLFGHYARLVAGMSPSGEDPRLLFDAAVGAHVRVVFKPTRRERTWFSSVFHVENYGVFEQSQFVGPQIRWGLVDRLRFLMDVAKRRDVGALGFWPWSTLYERGGAIPAALYAALRRLAL